MIDLSSLPAAYREEAALLLLQDPEFSAWAKELEGSAYYTFRPRPDDPANFDQQSSYVYAKDQVSFLLGGNACLAADSLIYDPVAKRHREISALREPSNVLARNLSTNQMEVAEASPSFSKGLLPLVRIVLADGQSFVAAEHHFVLSALDGWIQARHCAPGTFLVSDRAPGIICVDRREFVGTGEAWDITVARYGNYEHAGAVHHNSGKTSASALKCANFLMTTPPPRPNTPFWIIAQTYDQSGLVCWEEKLLSQGFLPKGEIDFNGIGYLRKGIPRSVPLKPWPSDRPGAKPGCNWVLEIKSCEQGRGALQARSIGGFWFSEQFPLDIFLETLRGCREYMFPGGQFSEFTPIDPDLCLWVESLIDEEPKGWGFYRANTEANRGNLAPEWFDQFFAAVPEEMLATRKTGALASFEGVIFQSFSPSIHCVDDFPIPKGAYHNLGTDWGSSQEHPHATVFFCRDGMGTIWVYDEYWSPDCDKITLDHLNEIVSTCEAWGWPCDQIKDRKTNEVRTVLAGDDPLWGLNYADPSRPGEINEFNFWGIPTAPGLNGVLEGIDFVRSLMKCRPPKNKPLIFISRKCKRLIQELRKYRWKRGSKPSVRNPQVAALEPLKKDNDLVDALRYGVFSAHKMRGAGISSASQKPADIRRRSVQLKAEGAINQIDRQPNQPGGSARNGSGWFRPHS